MRSRSPTPCATGRFLRALPGLMAAWVAGYRSVCPLPADAEHAYGHGKFEQEISLAEETFTEVTVVLVPEPGTVP